MQQLLEIEDLHCRYGDTPVVSGLSLSVHAGMLACLLGPSGCGKTTVLRAIAGFEPVSGGSIRLRGKEVSRPGLALPPERRGLGMVFQDYALFPHLSVADNIGFGLRGLSARERDAAVARLLELVGMPGTGGRYPHELSGGQQQRVSLARALAPEPPLLLLDEPFSNLDVELRARLVGDVRDILRAQGTAALFVTHDQHEAFAMGERVGVMHEGRIAQWDTPFNLYHEPADRFVADFIGQGRLLGGLLVAPDTVETPLGSIHGNRAYNWPRGCHVDVLLRPDDIVIGGDEGIECEITERAFRGAETLYTLRLPGDGEVLSLMPSHCDFLLGQRVKVALQVDHLVLFQG
jgi:iron(III) transport system ATP-binding protein